MAEEVYLVYNLLTITIMTEFELRNLAKACAILDKLQVELCDETPYETPPTDIIRDRILCVMDYLDKLVPDYNPEFTE